MKAASPNYKSEFPIKESFIDTFDPEWLKKNSKNILLAFGLAMLLLIIGAKYFFTAGLKAESDYIAADTYFTEMKTASIKGDKDTALKSYQQLKVVLEKHPELTTKYNGLLGQLLILLGESKEAAPYLKEGIQNLIARGLNLYSTLSESSQLAANQDLPKAADLEKKLLVLLSQNQDQETEYLKAYNLLQLSFIEMALNQPSTYGSEVEALLKDKDSPLSKIGDKFTQGEAKLIDALKAK